MVLLGKSIKVWYSKAPLHRIDHPEARANAPELWRRWPHRSKSTRPDDLRSVYLNPE